MFTCEFKKSSVCVNACMCVHACVRLCSCSKETLSLELVFRNKEVHVHETLHVILWLGNSKCMDVGSSLMHFFE